MTLEIVPYPDEPALGVTRCGRVFRLARPRNGRVCPYELKRFPSKRGYLTVSVNRASTPVHILVARTFIPNPEGKPEVAHNNGRKHDNEVENLRWATRKENNDDRFAHGTVLRGDQHPTRKLSQADVVDIRSRYAAGGVFHRELAAEFGVTRECVGVVCRRERWAHV